MSAKEKPTAVIFRKWMSNGSVIALFPDIKDGPYIGSYEQIGQHANADYGTVMLLTDPADPAEYRELKEELERIGYTLVVRKRRSFPRSRD